MKEIKIRYGEKEYTLAFTRDAVTKCEKMGFILKELDEKLATQTKLLFKGAFLVHHRFVQEQTINEIFDNLENKDDVIGALVEMYQDTLLTMISNTDENPGNIKWEKNW